MIFVYSRVNCLTYVSLQNFVQGLFKLHYRDKSGGLIGSIILAPKDFCTQTLAHNGH